MVRRLCSEDHYSGSMCIYHSERDNKPKITQRNKYAGKLGNCSLYFPPVTARKFSAFRGKVIAIIFRTADVYIDSSLATIVVQCTNPLINIMPTQCAVALLSTREARFLHPPRISWPKHPPDTNCRSCDAYIINTLPRGMYSEIG